MKHMQYLHHAKHVRLLLRTDKKRGYETLDIEIIGEDGSQSQLAIFFCGKADITGGEITALVLASDT